MTLEPEVLAGKGTNVDDAELVRLARLDGDGEVLRLVHEGGLGHGLGAGRVGLCEELRDQVLHLVVVPVRQGEDELMVNFVLVGEVWVVDDERAAQTVGVLGVGVRVVPIRARLVDLVAVRM